MMSFSRCLLLPVLLFCMTACVAPREHRLIESRYASGSIPAIKELGQSKKPVSHEQLKELIDQLESDDSAVRIFAAEALEKLTGSTRDYDYYDDDTDRQKAVDDWRAWLSAQPDPYYPMSSR